MRFLHLLFVLMMFFGHTLTADDFNLPPGSYAEIGASAYWDNPIIRIWGWSKNGNAALSTEVLTQRPSRIINFNIQNLITDEVIFNLDIEVNEEGYKARGIIDGKNKTWELDISEMNVIPDLYEPVMPEILRAIKNNGIVEHHTALLKFPSVIGNSNYTAYTRVKEENDSTGMVKFDIIVKRNEKEKIIKTASNFFREDQVIGYYKSPFENRVLVLSGASMSSHSVTWRFSGCHLNVGFD